MAYREINGQLTAAGVNLAIVISRFNSFFTAQLLKGALDCADDMLRLAPDAAPLWREAGLMNQRLERIGAALACFDRFLDLVPEGDAAARIRALTIELRQRLN